MSMFNKTLAIALFTFISVIYSDRLQAQTESELLQQIEQYSQEDRPQNIEQVTNVNQLRDVSPTDWSYEALRSLSDRYGCISGFPDGTYRGDRPITRNEFAAGLNSCFEQIERSINSSSVSIDDSSEFVYYEFKNPEAELATFIGRLDELESRTILLEKNRFSPTTKIDGNTTFGVTSVSGD